MIRFETDRLILRNYTMDDVPAVHEYFSNEEVSRYEDFWPQTIEEVADGLSEWKDMDNRMAVVLNTVIDVSVHMNEYYEMLTPRDILLRE